MTDEENKINETTGSAAEAETAEPDLSYKNKGQVFKGGLLGLFIGLAIIVPGVSGAAVAIIFRLYEKLLYAMGNLFKKFKKCTLFLLPVIAGGVVGLALGFFGVKNLLALLPFAIVALFAGLMFGSYPAITDQLKGEKRSAGRIVLFAIGLLVPVAISVTSVVTQEGVRSLESLTPLHYVLFLLLGYAVAITQIAPGLSATALLMVFGYFTPLMNSISLTYWTSNPQIFIVYGCLIVGFLLGLVTFSKALTKLFGVNKGAAYYCFAGLSLGSAATMFFNPEIYAVYSAWASSGIVVWELILGIALFVGGLIAAYKLVAVERKKDAGETK